MRRTERLADLATIIISALAVLVGGVFVAERLGWRRTPSAEAESAYEEVSDWRRYAEAGHRLGDPLAPVTIVEFGDYQCPACRGWQPHIEAVLRKYGDHVSFVYRHWPLSYHQYAYPAARAAECAGAQRAFWAFHRQLYAHANWLGDAMTRFAVESGVQDIGRFEQCVADPAPVAAIEADIAAVIELGGTGTPTVVVNGRRYGAPPDSITLGRLIQELIR